MLNASQLGLRDFRKDREESPNKPAPTFATHPGGLFGASSSSFSADSFSGASSSGIGGAKIQICI